MQMAKLLADKRRAAPVDVLGGVPRSYWLSYAMPLVCIAVVVYALLKYIRMLNGWRASLLPSMRRNNRSLYSYMMLDQTDGAADSPKSFVPSGIRIERNDYVY